jgi:hypothetical protein
MRTRKKVTIIFIITYWLISIFFSNICEYFELINNSIINILSLFFLPPFLLGSMLGVLGGAQLMFVGHLISLYLIFLIIKKKTNLLD